MVKRQYINLKRAYEANDSSSVKRQETSQYRNLKSAYTSNTEGNDKRNAVASKLGNLGQFTTYETRLSTIWDVIKDDTTELQYFLSVCDNLLKKGSYARTHKSAYAAVKRYQDIAQTKLQELQRQPASKLEELKDPLFERPPKINRNMDIDREGADLTPDVSGLAGVLTQPMREQSPSGTKDLYQATLTDLMSQQTNKARRAHKNPEERDLELSRSLVDLFNQGEPEARDPIYRSGLRAILKTTAAAAALAMSAFTLSYNNGSNSVQAKNYENMLSTDYTSQSRNTTDDFAKINPNNDWVSKGADEMFKVTPIGDEVPYLLANLETPTKTAAPKIPEVTNSNIKFDLTETSVAVPLTTVYGDESLIVEPLTPEVSVLDTTNADNRSATTRAKKPAMPSSYWPVPVTIDNQNYEVYISAGDTGELAKYYPKPGDANYISPEYLKKRVLPVDQR